MFLIKRRFSLWKFDMLLYNIYLWIKKQKLFTLFEIYYKTGKLKYTRVNFSTDINQNVMEHTEVNLINCV